MVYGRRELVVAGFALLAGCSRFSTNDAGTSEPTPTAETTTIPPEDYSLPDLHIFNDLDRPVSVTVSFVPEDRTDPVLELSVRVAPEEVVEWGGNPLLDDPGRISATVEDESSDAMQDESDWRGDTADDNRGVVVIVEQDGLTVGERIA